jgi:biotin synthase
VDADQEMFQTLNIRPRKAFKHGTAPTRFEQIPV